MTSTYLGYRLYANDFSQTLQRFAQQPSNARETAYYEANIGKVTSVAQFVGNYRLFSYAMQAFGLSDLGNAKGLMTKVLESNLSDPQSLVNTLSDKRYLAFAKAFQFSSSGAAASNAAAVQTGAQQSDTTARFEAASTLGSAASQSATSYWNTTIGSVTSVDQLEADPRLMAYLETAYGIDPGVSDSQITAALESDSSDPASFANSTTIPGLKQLAADFNFTATGAVGTSRVFQGTADVTATTSAYSAAKGTGAAAAAETAYYQATIPKITSLSQFVGDPRLVAYAVTAYGLPPSTSAAEVGAILQSDLTSTTSVANKLGTAAQGLAAAFNVTKTGTIAAQPTSVAQSRSQVESVTQAYVEQSVQSDAESTGEGVRLALYFRQQAPSITNAYQILSDKALTEVVQTMLGLPATASNADIDSQAATINDKLNYADLKNPAKVDQLIARFSALYDIKNGTNDTSWVSMLF